MGKSCSKKTDPNQQVKHPSKHTGYPELSKTDRVCLRNFSDVDEHARNVPGHVRNSVPELVKYLTTGTRDPKLHVRAFFIWITDNISYDADGYFRRSEMSPIDAESVLKNGKGVCQGYSNLMEAFCKEANIPVQTIAGFAKGYGYSPKRPFFTSNLTNHAWTAVQLDGKWHLLDATWGAGQVGFNGKFEKKFNNFYFLTNPKYFVSDHFPHMTGDKEASSQWQLLNEPISLQQFNDSIMIKADAFQLGVAPKSHPNAIIEAKNDITVTFTKPQGDKYGFSATLMKHDGKCLEEKPCSTFVVMDENISSVRVRPRELGSYILRIFAQEANPENIYDSVHLFEYDIECNEVNDSDFRFPGCYSQSIADKCILITPLHYWLVADSEVFFQVKTPILQKVRVEQTLLEKNGSDFTGIVNVDPTQKEMTVWGTTDAKSNNAKGLFRFKVCN